MNPLRLLVPLVGLFLVLLIVGCDSDVRAQHAADARAGIQAAVQAAPESAQILAGVDARLPAVAGVNSADWPVPAVTPAQIKADPGTYAKSAPPEPSRAWILAACASGGIAALGLLRVVAPLIPGGGPVVKLAADAVWSVMAHKDQKAADDAADVLRSAVATAAPVLHALRNLPPDQVPASVRRLLDSPVIVQAMHLLADQGAA